MDTYADTYTSYRADLDYRREQLIADLGADRSRRRHSLRAVVTALAPARPGHLAQTSRPARTSRPACDHVARSA